MSLKSCTVICLEKEIHIYKLIFRILRNIHVIRTEAPNPQGIIDLSLRKNLLAYPGSTDNGELLIYDTKNLCPKVTILAHKSPLATFAFDKTGTRIATASIYCALIKVFSTTTAQILYVFKKSSIRTDDIYCLTFSPCSKYLCCTGKTTEVCLFKLRNLSGRFKKKCKKKGSWVYCFSSSSTVRFGKPFAIAHLPQEGVKVATFGKTTEEELFLAVATEEQPALYIYKMHHENLYDINIGLALHKQYLLYCPETEDSETSESDDRAINLPVPASILWGYKFPEIGFSID